MNHQPTSSETPNEPLQGGKSTLIRRCWNWFWSPSATIAWGLIAVVGFGLGIIFWGGFNWAMEATNTEQFCIGCHEMKTNVYMEYRNTVHYSNRTGVRAICSDCHVPKEWGHKMVRKIQASNEVYHKILGSIDTPEKFNAHRIELSKSVWRATNLIPWNIRHKSRARQKFIKQRFRKAKPVSTAIKVSHINCRRMHIKPMTRCFQISTMSGRYKS